MLELRPNCERCDKDLPATANDAYICTYECTFCKNCVDTVLKNVCPNCGGNFCQRPIRPTKAYRPNLSLTHQPSSPKRINTEYSDQEIISFSDRIKHLEPKNR